MHEGLLDDVATYALGALPASEGARVRAHLDTCEECRAEYDALRQSVTALATSAEACADEEHGAVVASPLLKARIMREVRAELVAPVRTRTPWSMLAVAASITLAIGMSTYAFSLNERLAALQTKGTHAIHDTDDSRMLADIKSTKAKRYAITGGEIVVAQPRVYITMIDMPKPPPGKVYQAWTLEKGEKAVRPSVTFTPDSRGVALVSIPNTSHTLAAVAVSIEPEGGSKAPTSTPLFVRNLDS
jgi:anti-sigma-K factor RskA